MSRVVLCCVVRLQFRLQTFFTSLCSMGEFDTLLLRAAVAYFTAKRQK